MGQGELIDVMVQFQTQFPGARFEIGPSIIQQD